MVSFESITSSVYFVYALKGIGALLIFLIGKQVASWLARLLTKAIRKSTEDETIISFISSALYIVFLLCVVFAALSELGIHTTSFIAMLSAIGLAIGLALKDTFSSVGAGLIIVFFKPFGVGDTIEASGVRGTVESINIFSSVLKTADNKIIIIPNSRVISSNIVNESAKRARRVDMIYTISNDDDLLKTKSLLKEIANSNQYVLKSPEPLIAVSELASDGVKIAFRVWVKTTDFSNAQFTLNEEVKLRFDKEGINPTKPSRIQLVKE